jgi:FMN phosphatase YigB (HAD superfamily)
MDYVLIFDLDDTLIFHRNDVNYQYIFKNYELCHYLNGIKYPKYIFTNGTISHAEVVLKKMDIYDKFDKIYARDTINDMKPNMNAYMKVNNDIVMKYPNHKIIFLDDNIDNINASLDMNWTPVYINQMNAYSNSNIERFNTIIDFLKIIK